MSALLPPTSTRAARRGGFTLVEVMVALFVMALMAGLAWRGIDAIAHGRTIGRDHLEQTLRIDTVMTQWQQDVQAIYNSSVVPAIAFDGATLRLTRRTDAGVEVVAWSLRNGDWLRWTGPAVTRREDLTESWMRSQQLLGTEPGTLRLLRGVAAWQVYFCHANQCWSNAQSTGNLANGSTPATSANPAATPTAPTTAMPSGVRIVLGFTGTPLQGTLTRDLAIPGGS